MRKSIAAILLCIAPLAAQAEDDLQARKAESIEVVKAFMGELKGQLQGAMKSGGPIHAIGVCSQIAPAIAAEHSEATGWEVGRTSLRYRNPDNAPDAWETRVLKQFDQRRAEGEDPATMAYAEVVETEGQKAYRFMKAIPTGKACLKCHGSDIAEPVRAKLNELYPEDRATGFKLGDIRGAFTITQPME